MEGLARQDHQLCFLHGNGAGCMGLDSYQRGFSETVSHIQFQELKGCLVLFHENPDFPFFYNIDIVGWCPLTENQFAFSVSDALKVSEKYVELLFRETSEEGYAVENGKDCLHLEQRFTDFSVLFHYYRILVEGWAMSNGEPLENYRFRCICCGDCCTGNMEININLFDLHKLGKRLEMESTSELFSSGLVGLFEGQNGVLVPRIIFKTRPFPFCPWLINDPGDDGVLRGFCSMHPHDKPLVCKLAPVSRTVDFADDSEIFYLTAPTENCPGMKYSDDNSLRELKSSLRRELAYEKRFYRILERMTHREECSESDFINLYTFDCSRSFDEILKERE